MSSKDLSDSSDSKPCAVEEMSSCIEVFSREMLSSSIIKEHRELLLPLKKMTTAILALATVTDGAGTEPPNDESQVEDERPNNKYEIGSGHDGNMASIATTPSESLQEQHSTNKETHIHNASTQDEGQMASSTSNQDNPHESGVNTLHMEQWLSGITPYGFTQRLPVESLAYRLVNSSINTALKALKQPMQLIEPRSEQSRVFGTSVPAKHRASLISQYKWLLGPGTACLYDCAKLWLIALGARNRHQDFIELEIENPHKTEEDMGQHFMSYWAVGNYDPLVAELPKRTTVTIHLSASLLIANLAKRAVCLGRGPAFPLSHLGTAIEASVVGAHGDSDIY
ncbi:hypothetical protein F53441_8681 [Fusarium austroafricanum]|uniref:Transcription factor domain-containing protein n=1 Tax=Fusarium austroafricanum TaxID=2364996 RepID=A0A8H4KCQ1_9HYPO|nr:hypothetical protein F53441_8681 [Fusarium austroafricanum]